MRLAASAAAVALAIALLAGCKAKQQQGGAAAGEVLEGSVSDAMIAPDALRAEPPLAPRPASSGEAPAKGKTGAKAAAKSADGEAEPVASPTPEATPPAAPTPGASPD